MKKSKKIFAFLSSLVLAAGTMTSLTAGAEELGREQLGLDELYTLCYDYVISLQEQGLTSEQAANIINTIKNEYWFEGVITNEDFLKYIEDCKAGMIPVTKYLGELKRQFANNVFDIYDASIVLGKITDSCPEGITPDEYAEMLADEVIGYAGIDKEKFSGVMANAEGEAIVRVRATKEQLLKACELEIVKAEDVYETESEKYYNSFTNALSYISDIKDGEGTITAVIELMCDDEGYFDSVRKALCDKLGIEDVFGDKYVKADLSYEQLENVAWDMSVKSFGRPVEYIDFEDAVFGDTNCDGNVNLADAVIIMQHISNPDKYFISGQGKKNGDVVGGDGLTSKDALSIQRRILGL